MIPGHGCLSEAQGFEHHRVSSVGQPTAHVFRMTKCSRKCWKAKLGPSYACCHSIPKWPCFGHPRMVCMTGGVSLWSSLAWHWMPAGKEAFSSALVFLFNLFYMPPSPVQGCQPGEGMLGACLSTQSLHHLVFNLFPRGWKGWICSFLFWFPLIFVSFNLPLPHLILTIQGGVKQIVSDVFLWGGRLEITSTYCSQFY